MDQNTFQILIDACEDAGFSPYAYSGRGMFGSKCLGFDCSNPARAALDFARALYSGEAEGTRVLDELMDTISNSARWDSMGRDYVLYFESVKWQGSERRKREDDEDGSEDDDGDD